MEARSRGNKNCFFFFLIQTFHYGKNGRPALQLGKPLTCPDIETLKVMNVCRYDYDYTSIDLVHHVYFPFLSREVVGSNCCHRGNRWLSPIHAVSQLLQLHYQGNDQAPSVFLFEIYHMD
jgi:hypothetical protein